MRLIPALVRYTQQRDKSGAVTENVRVCAPRAASEGTGVGGGGGACARAGGTAL